MKGCNQISARVWPLGYCHTVLIWSIRMSECPISPYISIPLIRISLAYPRGWPLGHFKHRYVGEHRKSQSTDVSFLTYSRHTRKCVTVRVYTVQEKVICTWASLAARVSINFCARARVKREQPPCPLNPLPFALIQIPCVFYIYTTMLSKGLWTGT